MPQDSWPNAVSRPIPRCPASPNLGRGLTSHYSQEKLRSDWLYEDLAAKWELTVETGRPNSPAIRRLQARSGTSAPLPDSSWLPAPDGGRWVLCRPA